MLDYWWMARNETERYGSEAMIEELLQDPSLAILFVGYPRWLLCLAAACCVLFMLIGIPGNLITVVALFRIKKLKNATTVFIMNLSISDLMFCCFNLPLATSTFWHGTWLHGPLLCRLFPLLRYGLVAVSLFTVLAITINRYVMIGHPGLYPKLYKRGYLIPMLLAIWIAAFGVLIVTWFERWGRFGLDPAIGSCSILPDANGQNPKEFLFVLAFLIPCLAIVFCYARIFYIVRTTASRSRSRDKVVNMEPVETSHERRSASTRNQEEEHSVLHTPASPMQPVFLRPRENLDLDSQSGSADEHSRRTESPIRDQRATDDPRTSPSAESVRLDPHSSSGYDTLHASLTTTAGDGPPFMEQPDLAVGIEDFESAARSPCGRLDRTASHSSLVVESSSLWTRQKRITSDVDSSRSCSRSPEPTFAKRANRVCRRSQFRCGRETRCNDGESAPRISTKDRKLLRMILVIFSSFLVCYLPITVTKLFRSAVDWRGLNIAGYILIYLTTCINPVIYVVMSSEYRSAYKYVLLCRREQAREDRRIYQC